MRVLRVLALLALGTLGCGQKQVSVSTPAPSADPATAASATSAGSPAPVTPSSPVPTASGVAAAVPTGAPGGAACGKLACELFDTPEGAFDRLLADKPAVLAIGETHAQKDDPQVPSVTKRFTQRLLPRLEGKASDLVLELWVANNNCNAQQKKEIKQVASAQKAVTENQAQSNQGEFIALYTAARQKKIRSHLLVPSCDEYGKIVAAGGGDIDTMLSMIARLTAEKIESISAGDHALVVAYGGAMHNDREPRPGREPWSYGPRVAKAVPAYVEVDLIVPELVKDTDAWRSQPWYPHYTRGAQGARTLLYTLRPGAYVVVFPETPK